MERELRLNLPKVRKSRESHSNHHHARFINIPKEQRIRKNLMGDKIKKIVLAYSGGLDTSVILKWLKETYKCQVVAFCADLGQGEDLAAASTNARATGADEVFVEELREEFVRDFVWPMFRANALYEGAYLLGTSIARPLIAKGQVEAARRVGAG